MAVPEHDDPEAPRGASVAAPAGLADDTESAARGHGRVRLSMYLAFAMLAVMVLLQGFMALRLDAAREADAGILELASRQHAFAQHLGRLAAQGPPLAGDDAARARHAEELEALLTASRADALRIDELLQQQHPDGAGAATPLRGALEAWHAGRERLWYRGALLLRADAGTPADIERATAALQREVEPAAQLARQLSTVLRDAAAQHAEVWRQRVMLGGAMLLLLLLALALGVVEPTARAVRRDGRRLREQARDLQRLALVAERTMSMVIITDREDRIEWANDAFERIAGWPLAEALGRRPGELMHTERADPQAMMRLREALGRGRGVRQEILIINRAGAEVWIDIDLRPLHDAQGALTGFVSVSADVTARVQQQAKLQALWAALPTGVVVQSASGTILEANRAAEALLGMSLSQMQGIDSSDPCWRAVRADGSDYPGTEHPAMRTLATGLALRNETMGVHTGDGRLRWLLVNTEPQRDASGQVTGVVACFGDITESRALQDRLSDSALTDALTLLPNRAVAMDRLQRAIDHARRHPGYGFAVLFMDFDRFKQVNDTLGHAAGDELLRQIARRLELAVRPGDAVARLAVPGGGDPTGTPVAARLGGDEFVVVLEGVNDASQLAAITERLLKELGEPYLIGCNPVQSTVSIGVVLHAGTAGPADDPEWLLSAEDVLRNADTAMYEAKRAGRARWVMFDDSMHERVVRALAVEADLRRALKEDELFVVYQPVMDLERGAMVGVEALVRWRHPERGLVMPVEFIGVAEECGLIDALGAAVLRMATAQFMDWQARLGEQAPRQLAVNLSRAQLQNAALVDDVRAVLQGCGMAPEQLQLEVTESLAAQDERVQATLRELKSLGVRLALDDFGTGYSSLACLHQMPVDTVKVDRSFVKHAETVEYHRVLIEATIRVARTLGMTTVAEGIETAGQAELMRTLECDRGQGYLFSRPLEAAALEAWALERVDEAADTV